MEMHKSYLEFGYHVNNLLFKGLTAKSVSGMVGLCLSVAAFTFTYEAVKTLRQHFASVLSKGNHERNASLPFGSESMSERAMLVEIKSSHSDKWRRVKVHIFQALLYMAQVTMGYMLMLVIMSYNAWLAITVFTTAGLSYYFFSTCVLYRPSVIPIEILAPEETSQ